MRFKYTKGKTIDDLMSMDISKEPEAVKKEIVSRLYETANRRISRTTKSERETNPAYQKALKTGLMIGGKFSLKKNFYIPKKGQYAGEKRPRSYEQMFYAARSFLKNDASYKKAYKDFMKDYPKGRDKKTSKDEYLRQRQEAAQEHVEELDELKNDVWKQIVNKLKYDPDVIRSKYREIEELVDMAVSENSDPYAAYFDIEDKIDEVISESLDYEYDFGDKDFFV